MENHIPFMERALELAALAGSLGEVPVGAVVVMDGVIVAEGYNRRELDASCLAHAELLALRDACQKLGRWRLNGAVVYSTLEPCIMCAGALLHARVEQVVYGAKDAKFGGIESLYTLASDPRLNHRIKVLGNVLADESITLLKEFFIALRAPIV